jgi:hypothetical protein
LSSRQLLSVEVELDAVAVAGPPGGGRRSQLADALRSVEPDANVMPMQVRANLGTRLILRVDSVGTSEIALGESGAERLLGKGHLLAKLEGANRLQYAQVPFVDAAFMDEFVRAQRVKHVKREVDVDDEDNERDEGEVKPEPGPAGEPRPVRARTNRRLGGIARRLARDPGPRRRE